VNVDSAVQVVPWMGVAYI